MTPNIGNMDRILRVVAGVAIIVLGIVYGSWWGVIGVLPLLTALIRWCPPYAILGISTCRAESAEDGATTTGE